MTDQLPLDTPLSWLREQLDDYELGGVSSGELTTAISGRVRVDDIRHWSRSGLQKAITAELKGRGLVPNLAKVGEDGGAPYVEIPTLDLVELETLLAARHKQALEDRDAALTVANTWCSAHPEARLTGEQLMVKVGWAA